MPQQKIDQFINQVLTEAKLTNLSEEFESRYRLKIQEEVEKRLLKAIIINLPENELDSFKGVAKKSVSSPEDLEKFLTEHVKDYPQIIDQELEKFKQIFIDKISALKK